MVKKIKKDKNLVDLIEDELDKAGFLPTPITAPEPIEEPVEEDPNEARKASLMDAIRTHAKRTRK